LIGSGFVFTRDPVSGHWGLNQSYPSPAGTEGHFGYAVDIAKNFSVIGAYGFGELALSLHDVSLLFFFGNEPIMGFLSLLLKLVSILFSLLLLPNR